MQELGLIPTPCDRRHKALIRSDVGFCLGCAVDYKAPLNLPKTTFPMKADLTGREPEMLRSWEEGRIYQKLRELRAGREMWSVHAGPPYAHGHNNIGHALNKILKDFVVKSRSMMGYNAVFFPGWDCHGLPIEHQVDKELG